MSALPQTEPENRAGMYKDLRELLHFGHLSETVEVGDTVVSLRSLYPKDLYLLRHRVGPRMAHRTSSDRWMSWFAASAIWMMDGQVLLEDPQIATRLFNLMYEVPELLRQNIAHVVSSLQARANKALDFVEPFVYESESRSLWRSFGARIQEVSGFGNRLGYNLAQKLWVAHNNLEDYREELDAQWRHTKFIASAMTSSKAMSSINKADEEAQDNEIRRRQLVRDVAFAEWRGLEVPKEAYDSQGRALPQGKNGAPPRTEEVLFEEMRRVQLGIKDDHDRIIDAYKAQVQARIEKQRQDRQRKLDQLRAQMESSGATDDALRPLQLTSETLATQFTRNRKRRDPAETKQRAAFLKFISNDPIAGQLKGDIPIPLASLGDRLEERKPGVGA